MAVAFECDRRFTCAIKFLRHNGCPPQQAKIIPVQSQQHLVLSIVIEILWLPPMDQVLRLHPPRHLPLIAQDDREERPVLQAAYAVHP